MLEARLVADDVEPNLQLALAIELAVLPPYLYALWSIESQADGAGWAATEAATVIRNVAYEEMLHIALVANVLRAIGATPNVFAYPMTYPGFLPGHVDDFQVCLGPLSESTAKMFMQIELPEWGPPPPTAAAGQITIGAFYELIKGQLRGPPPQPFPGGPQILTADNPGAGSLLPVTDLDSALDALQIVIDQGEGHQQQDPHGGPAFEDDDDHEVAHYYQFATIAKYLAAGSITPATDVRPVIENPDASLYDDAQCAANTAFNTAYSRLLDGLALIFKAPSPEVFGPLTDAMGQLSHLAALLRQTGTVGKTQFVPGPTFEYIPQSGGHA